MKNNRNFLLVIMMLNFLGVYAQDIKFSQYYNTPTFYNPANAGIFNGDLRTGIFYKNQWTQMGSAYNNYALSIDGSFMVKNDISYKRNYIGYAAYIATDKGGDLNLRNTESMFAVNYNLEMGGNELNNHSLAMGINLGFNIRSFDPENGKWGSQWNEIFQEFDPSVDPNEYMFTERKINLDVGFGLTYIYNKDKFHPYDKFHMELGIAFTHLNV